MLLFDRNGVFVNVRSLTAAADRIGHFRLSRDLNPHASPAWQRLTGGHSFLWHDHRLHALEPLAKGDARRTVIGRWSIPLSIDGRPRPLEGELTYIPPRPLWPWLLVAGALAAGVWLGLAVSESPAVGSTIGAALVVTVVVWAIRIGRESRRAPRDRIDVRARRRIPLGSAAQERRCACVHRVVRRHRCRLPGTRDVPGADALDRALGAADLRGTSRCGGLPRPRGRPGRDRSLWLPRAFADRAANGYLVDRLRHRMRVGPRLPDSSLRSFSNVG